MVEVAAAAARVILPPASVGWMCWVLGVERRADCAEHAAQRHDLCTLAAGTCSVQRPSARRSVVD